MKAVQHPHAKPVPVPNSVLVQLSRHDPMRAVGEASAQNKAILSMYLPDMCGEMVANRAELEILREEVRAQRARKQGFAASLAARLSSLALPCRRLARGL
jgi:hypothetical protein